jgi:hypothetical protein
MKLKVAVPVIFQAPVTRSGGPKSILAFVDADLELREATEAQATLAISQVLRPERLARDYRLYEGRLFSATRRINDDPSPDRSDPVDALAFKVELALAELALEQLSQVGSANVYPRDSIALLKDVTKPDSLRRGVGVKRQEYLTAVSAKTEAMRIRDIIEGNNDYQDARSRWLTRAVEMLDEQVLIDGKLFEASHGMAVRVRRQPNAVIIGEVDIEASGITSEDSWFTPLGMMNYETLNTGTVFFSSTDLDEAVSFTKELAAREKIEFKFDDKQPAYAIARDEVPCADMRFAELVRAAKAVTFVVGCEISRRYRKELAVFADDPSVRYAFDRLRESVVATLPFGEPNDAIEAALIDMLETLNANPSQTNTMFRNILNQKKLFEFAQDSLARWDERPLRIMLEQSPMTIRQP